MSDSVPITVTETVWEEGSLRFTLQNTGDEAVYDIAKLYVGDDYFGFDYVDLDPDETTQIAYDTRGVTLDEDGTLVLTTHTRDEGVISAAPFQEVVGGRGSEPDTEDATGPGFLSRVRNSLFGGADEEVEEEDEDDESAANDEESGEGEEDTDNDEEEGDAGRRPRHEPLPSEQVKRLETGIINLDDKMQGGLVEGTMNLVTGKTGTGKTAFCASFLKKGVDNGQTGVYVTTEERKEDIRADIQSMFGWDVEKMENAGQIKVMSIKPIFPSKEVDNLNRLVRSYITDLLDNVKQAIDELDAERVVIDSVSIIEMFIRDEYMARVALSSLLNNLREADVTAVLTGTVPETSEGLSGGGIIEFLVDTVLLMEFVPVAEEHKRTLTIRKMRRTDHDVDIFPFEITPDGIKVYSPR